MFLAAGSNYKDLLSSFKCQEAKVCFPYDWFTDIDKLQYSSLPPIDTFYSVMKLVFFSTPYKYVLFCHETSVLLYVLFCH